MAIKSSASCFRNSLFTFWTSLWNASRSFSAIISVRDFRASFLLPLTFVLDITSLLQRSTLSCFPSSSHYPPTTDLRLLAKIPSQPQLRAQLRAQTQPFYGVCISYPFSLELLLPFVLAPFLLTYLSIPLDYRPSCHLSNLPAFRRVGLLGRKF